MAEKSTWSSEQLISMSSLERKRIQVTAAVCPVPTYLQLNWLFSSIDQTRTVWSLLHEAMVVLSLLKVSTLNKDSYTYFLARANKN